MNTTMANVMNECKNYFLVNYARGTFSITSGVLTVTPIPLKGSYIRIMGSVLNDGVYMVEDIDGTGAKISTEHDETFKGVVCYLAPPIAFIDLVGRIKKYTDHVAELDQKASETGSAPFGTIKSESFEGYSYTLSGGSSVKGGSGGVVRWQDVFAQDLSPYLRMFGERIVL